MKKSLFLASLLAAGMTLLTSCVGNKNTDATIIAEAEDTVAVTVEVVKMRQIEQTGNFSATVQAEVVNAIAPQAPVRIRQINAEVGDHVRKGQVLVVLDNTNLVQLKAQMDNLELEFSRIDELYKVGGVSKSQWDQVKTQLDVMRQQYANLEENTRLVSPINGVVSARNYDAGDLYAGKPVLVVEQISPVKLLLDVNEKFYQMVHVGMNIDDITLDAYPGETFKGQVSIVYPTVDVQTRTFQVEVKIANANQRVRPGMFARVSLCFGSVMHTTASDIAIQKQIGSGERYVFVLDPQGKTVHRRLVEVGRRLEGELATQYEIVSGLNEGEFVVTSGQSLLAEGRPVTVVNKAVAR